MANNNSMTNNKKKSNNIKISYRNIIIVILLILLCIISYAIYTVVNLIKNPTNTFTIEQGTIYQEETATGYIIRDEVVIRGKNYKNGIEQIKAEGERVAKNEAIFRYYLSGEDDILKKIQELDLKIDEALSKENTIFTSDIKAIEKQIDEKLLLIRNTNNLQEIEEYKKQINNNITKKAKIAGDLSPSGSYLKKLIDERSSYEKKLNNGAEFLKAPVSGVVSYKVDGYEEILSPNNFNSLNEELFNSLKIKTGEIVANSTESGKIIDNFKCYISCVLNSEQSKNAKVGDSVKLRLPSGTNIGAKIEYISSQNDKQIVVFILEKSVQELISYRKISFDVIWWSNTGKKIPNVAINYEEKQGRNVPYVIRTRAGYEDKILIKILRQNDKYAIVDNYKSDELKQLGYSAEEISNRKSITLYDEILKKTN